MNRRFAHLAQYLFYGLVAVFAALAAPENFGSWLALVVFGTVWATLMYTSNQLELLAWERSTPKQAHSVPYRLLLRSFIYIALPVVACLLLQAAAPGLFPMPNGLLRSTFQMVWCPLSVAAFLRYIPAVLR